MNTAANLVKAVTIMPCLLYEEFIEDKWKNKEIDYADVLSSSYISSVSDNNVRAGVDYELSTQISYFNKDSLNKEGRMISMLAFHLKSKKI